MYRSRLQIDGPYNESFLEKVKSCPAEDDGSVDYAIGKVSIACCCQDFTLENKLPARRPLQLQFCLLGDKKTKMF